MKIWSKITFYSLVVFIVIFNLSGILIIENNHGNILSQEVETSLNQTATMYKGITAMSPVFRIYNDENYTKELLQSYVNNIVYSSPDEPIYVEIFDNNQEMVYSNVTFEMPESRIEYEQITTGEIKYILREIDKRIYIFSSIAIPIENQVYNISYIKDLTHLYDNRIEQYQFFVILDGLAVLLYIGSMFLVSKSITKPIEKMVQSTHRITSGEYSERVEITKNDEMGILARDFNKMATAIEMKINELNQSNEDKQNFINDFTHELRTPLTSILGYADFLRKSPYNEELFIEALNTIYSEGKRLEVISVKLMDLVLLEKENLPLYENNLKSVIESIEPVLILKGSAQAIEINFDYDDCIFLMDVDLMKSLVINLTENAIKASSQGTSVKIRCYTHQDTCILSVEDKGRGIEKEHLERITEPFYMIDQVRTTKNNGLGLGLSICKKIVHLHQGILSIESEVGKGTTIRINFPKLKSEEVKNHEEN